MWGGLIAQTLGHPPFSLQRGRGPAEGAARCRPFAEVHSVACIAIQVFRSIREKWTCMGCADRAAVPSRCSLSGTEEEGVDEGRGEGTYSRMYKLLTNVHNVNIDYYLYKKAYNTTLTLSTTHHHTPQRTFCKDAKPAMPPPVAPESPESPPIDGPPFATCTCIYH